MAYTTGWGDETQTFVLTRFEGTLTWEQIYEALETLKAMMRSVEHPVDGISDLSGVTAHPAVGNILKMKPVYEDMPANMGISVVIGMPMFNVTMLNLFGSLYSKLTNNSRIVFANTMEEAYETLERERAKADRG